MRRKAEQAISGVAPFGGMFSQLVRSPGTERRSSHAQAVKDVTLQDAAVNAACVANVRVTER